MNRAWIIPAVVALAAGAIAFGVTRRAACSGSGDGLARLQDARFLARELKLSDDQARQIKALQRNLAVTLQDCCARHCAARTRLAQALADPTNGAARAEAVVADMCSAYEESERATLDHIQRVRAMLNAEQQRRFDALLVGCVDRTCGRNDGGMSCPAAGAD